MAQSNGSNGKELVGVVGFFDRPSALMDATRKTRDAGWDSFDVYTPYPMHGLEKAQGLRRSPLPWVTFGAGLTGFTCAFLLQYWTSAVSWPVNIGGKPLNSWPAFVPVLFELTVLFAGLATVAGMFILNGLPNLKRKAFDPSITRDRFAVMIEAPPRPRDEDEAPKPLKAGVRPFSESDAGSFLKGVGAQDVRAVYAEGWF